MLRLELFPANLRAEVWSRGMTNEEFAEAADLCKSTADCIMNGRRLPTLRTAVKICNALGLSIDAMLTEPYKGVRK